MLKRLGLILLLGGVILWITPHCGGGTENAEKDTVSGIKSYDRAETGDSQQVDGESGTRERYLKNLTIEPDVIKVDSEITLTFETDGSIPSHYQTVYVFWKNAVKLQEGADNMVAPRSYEKGELFYGEVLLMEDSVIVERMRTPMQEVLNSRPVIENVEIPAFEGFGIHRFKVMVNDADGDSITLKVEGENLPEGFSVDHEYSEVVYQMDKLPPEVLKFIIVADDGFGGVDKKVVTVNFPRGSKESGNVTVEES